VGLTIFGFTPLLSEKSQKVRGCRSWETPCQNWGKRWRDQRFSQHERI